MPLFPDASSTINQNLKPGAKERYMDYGEDLLGAIRLFIYHT
jgi:hypothetical protein